MRKSHQLSRQIVADEARVGGTFEAAVKRAPRDPLRLPRRIDAAPSLQCPCEDEALLVPLASGLLKAGYLHEQDEGDLMGLITRGINRLWEKTVGAPVCVVPLELVIARSPGELEEGLHCRDEPAEGYLYVGLNPVRIPQECLIGRSVQHLEQVHPGLGETVLAVMEYASLLTHAWTPASVRSMAEYVMWQGMDTQKEWEDEVRCMYGVADDGQEDEEIPWEELFGPADFEADFPGEWVHRPRRRLTQRKLRKLARRSPDPLVRQVCATVHALSVQTDGSGWQFPSPHEMELFCASASAFARWDESDALPRVIDDFGNQLMDSGEGTFLLASWELENTSAVWDAWIKHLTRGLYIYKSLDRLLAQVSGHQPGA